MLTLIIALLVRLDERVSIAAYRIADGALLDRICELEDLGLEAVYTAGRWADVPFRLRMDVWVITAEYRVCRKAQAVALWFWKATGQVPVRHRCA